MSESEDPTSRSDTTEAGAVEGDDREVASLDDLPDGVGCAEIWDHLSERRREG